MPVQIPFSCGKKLLSHRQAIKTRFSGPLTLTRNYSSAGSVRGREVRTFLRQATQQNLPSTIQAINTPVMTKPSTPARRSLLVTTPIRLKIKPSGVARRKVNPPRVVMGEPHPGWNSNMAASAARGASEM
jgi:hypothetical protein